MRSVPPGILPIISIDRGTAKPLYRQLYEGYRDAILERRLRPGQRLPSTRSLSSALQISRISILNAFEQLQAEGYLEGRLGSGTYVAATLPDSFFKPARPAAAGKPSHRPAKRTISHRARALLPEAAGPWLQGPGAFSIGHPPVDRFPAAVWGRLIARHSHSSQTHLLGYAKAMGFLPLREAVAEYLRTARAVRCEAEQVMIVGGSQHALELSVQVLVDSGRPAWVEEPGYWGARNALRLAGARLVPVPVDEEGLIIAAGIAKCPDAAAALVTPSHQYPLGVTMSVSRRLQLLDWARASGSWIIEDDYDSEYRYENLPVASLQGLDQDARVIYIGTFTKVLYPALRLGYIVIPPDLIKPFVEVRRAMDIFSPTFPQAVLADFMREGHFGRHIRRMRLLCRERRTALVEAIKAELEGLTLLGDEAGMYLTASLARGREDRDICLRAASEGLWAAPLSECYLETPDLRGLILGYGSTGAEEIATGIRRLRRIIHSSQTKLRETARPDAVHAPSNRSRRREAIV
jgi:GntR family transcriptional regulator / MocR family aminotransferase